MSNKINLIQENQQNSPSSIIQNINNSEIPTSLTQEIQNENSKNNISDISTILKEIPLHNLNDYYNIETNVFKKRIEKLNLQFFWIYESILEGQNINITDNNNNKQSLIFPYNKLFSILLSSFSFSVLVRFIGVDGISDKLICLEINEELEFLLFSGDLIIEANIFKFSNLFLFKL